MGQALNSNGEKMAMKGEYCNFCKKTLGSCTCDETITGDYFNQAKERDDPFG